MSEVGSEQSVSKAKLQPRDAKGRFMRVDTLPPAPANQSLEEKQRDYAQNAMNIAQEGNQPNREALIKSRQLLKDAQKKELVRQRAELAKTRAEMFRSKDLADLFAASPVADKSEKLSGEVDENGQFKLAKREPSRLQQLSIEAPYAQGPQVVSRSLESPVEPTQPESEPIVNDSKLSRWIKRLGRKAA